LSLRARLLVTFAPAMLVLFGTLFALAFNTSRHMLEQQIQGESRALARSHAADFERLFQTAQTVAQGLALAVADDPGLDSSRIEQRIRDTLEEHRYLYGSTVALVPSATALGRFSPYLYRRPQGILTTSLATAEYDYPHWDWFRAPLEQGHGVWGEPYFDKGGGNILMITYSAPIKRQGEIIGVATVDISIEGLIEQLRSLRVADSGYAFLVTASHRLIAHPAQPFSPGEEPDDSTQVPAAPYLAALDPVTPVEGGRFAAFSDPYLGKPSWLVSTPISATKARLMIVLPLDEVMRPVTRLKRTMLLSAVLIMVLTLPVVTSLAANITAPLSRLVGQAEHFSEGRLDRRLPEQGGPTETRRLAQAFNHMGAAIQRHIAEVRSATAEKERYHKELQIAAEIQQGILPHQFPPFPDLENRLELWGLTQPAREVGGDYYDFFRLSGDRIGLVVADVSDKGAAAALFMAITHTLVREVAHRRVPPAEVIRRINRTLADENPSSMFVTLVYGEYQTNTGHLALVNAGHNPPLLRRSAGTVEVLAVKPRLPLGAMPGTRYHTLQVELGPGDLLLFYSDGITETCNAQHQEWGLERLTQAFGQFRGDVRRDADRLLARLGDFRGATESQDDITLLLLRRPRAFMGDKGAPDRSRSVRMEWPASTEVLARIAGLIETLARDSGFDEQQTARLALAVNELVSNVIRHSKTNRFAMELAQLTSGLEVAVIDWGEPFDFETLSRGFPGATHRERDPGGVGLYLVRQSVDELRYEPGAADGNRVTLVKYLAASS